LEVRLLLGWCGIVTKSEYPGGMIVIAADDWNSSGVDLNLIGFTAPLIHPGLSSHQSDLGKTNLTGSHVGGDKRRRRSKPVEVHDEIPLAETIRPIEIVDLAIGTP